MMVPKFKFQSPEAVAEFIADSPSIVFNRQFKAIQEAYEKDKQIAFVFDIEIDDKLMSTMLTIQVSRPGWVNALTKALEYFESTEEYEKCSQIAKLISNIKNYNNV